MFTDPELGRVGLTETEAKKQNKEIKVNRFEMKKNGKAREISESMGFIKVIIEMKTKKVIGAAVLSNEGAEIIHGFVDLMNADLPFIVLKDAVHIHSTLFEAVQNSVKNSF